MVSVQTCVAIPAHSGTGVWLVCGSEEDPESQQLDYAYSFEVPDEGSYLVTESGLNLLVPLMANVAMRDKLGRCIVTLLEEPTLQNPLGLFPREKPLTLLELIVLKQKASLVTQSN